MTPALVPPEAARAIDWSRVLLVGILAAMGASLLAGLGVWQLERRLWKLDLIKKVQTRFYASPHALAKSVSNDPAGHDYERVELFGTYVPGADTWVHASTVEGAGYWILSPLRTRNNGIVLINRGFVPMDTDRARIAPPARNSVTGVLRMSEPSGFWPRRNRPDENRWYSREVAAIAHARGLEDVAPFFIDADAEPADATPDGLVHPMGGLTVVQFRNEHLAYAMTWFALALMTAFAGAHAILGELRGPAQRS